MHNVCSKLGQQTKIFLFNKWVFVYTYGVLIDALLCSALSSHNAHERSEVNTDNTIFIQLAEAVVYLRWLRLFFWTDSNTQHVVSKKRHCSSSVKARKIHKCHKPFINEAALD